MSMTDPIADLLTRIRNAIRAGHRRVEIPASYLMRAMGELRMTLGSLVSIESLVDYALGRLRRELVFSWRGGERSGGLAGPRSRSMSRWASQVRAASNRPWATCSSSTDSKKPKKPRRSENRSMWS